MPDEAVKQAKILSTLKTMKDTLLYFAKHMLKVQTTKGKIVPLQFNNPQKILHSIVEMVKLRRPVRLVALKARRMGFSTYFSARYYWRVSWNHNRYATQITHEPEATDALFKMVKRFYDFSPADMRPSTKYNNTRLLEFNTKDGRGLNSGFRVATAGKEDFGSGQLIHYCHLCMSPETPIILEHGKECLAKDVVIGDSVVTHNGNAGKISYITRKEGGRTLKVRPWMGRDIELTPEHKVWTNMGWVPAGELDPLWHMLSMPIREITHGIKSLPVEGRPSKYGPAYKGATELDMNEETGYFFGYYLAEGCVSSSQGNDVFTKLSFTLHQSEDAFADRATAAVASLLKKPPRIKCRKDTLTKTYDFDNGVLASFVDKYFGRVSTKHIPDWVFDCGEDFCRGLVTGYLAGDGSKGLGGEHQNYVSNSVTATSIRSSLVYQVRDIVAALGYGWGSVKQCDGGVRYGRNCLETWTVHFNGACGYELRKLIGVETGELSARYKAGERYRLDMNNRQVWMKIREITESTCDEVVDFEVDHPDHSFRTSHFSVSNSETSKWPSETTESLLTSILQCVPDDDESEVVFESTAKGIGGAFYDRFWGARYRVWVTRLDEKGNPVITEEVNSTADQENIYTSIFLPWFVFEENVLKAPDDFTPDKDELKMIAQYGVNFDQLYWRRRTLASKCDGNIDIFKQEYPANPQEAFLGTGRPVFDNTKLLRYHEALPEPIARYECLTGTGQWMTTPTGRLSVWEEPKPGRSYIIGADVSEGLAKGDYSPADVIDHQTGKQVAQWHGHVDPDVYAEILIALGKRYNMAWLGIERNNHGLTTVTWVCNARYPFVYAEMVPDPPGKPRKRYGWLTSSATRPLILDNLIREVREDAHGIMCRATIEEMMSFKIQDNGRFEADGGRFDDRVMSLAIAKYLRQTIPLPAMKANDKNFFQDSTHRVARNKKDHRGWT